MHQGRVPCSGLTFKVTLRFDKARPEVRVGWTGSCSTTLCWSCPSTKRVVCCDVDRGNKSVVSSGRSLGSHFAARHRGAQRGDKLVPGQRRVAPLSRLAQTLLAWGPDCAATPNRSTIRAELWWSATETPLADSSCEYRQPGPIQAQVDDDEDELTGLTGD